MTVAEFSEIFGVLSVQLRSPALDEAQSVREMKAYYAVLKDLDVELVRLAATDLAKSAEWFPKSSEWRGAAQRIERERTFQLANALRQMHWRGQELCANCGDTGWARDAADRVSKCECQSLRRLEILGRRPLPALRA